MYVKQGFVSKQLLKAEHLNHMEDGIDMLCKNTAYPIIDTSARAASHELHAQDGPLAVTLYGKTTETGTGDKSPDNPHTISGVETATVNAGGNEISMPLLPDGSPLHGNGTMDDAIENDVLSGCDKKIVLDGSQTPGSVTALTSVVRVVYSGLAENVQPHTVMTAYAAVRYCDRLTFETGWATDNEHFYVQAGGQIAIYIKTDRLASADRDGVNAYLAANPLTVYYRSTEYTPDKDLRVCRVVRRWGVIDSYSGESVTTEYVSSTGALDSGATVVYKLASAHIYMTDPLDLRKPTGIMPVTVTGSGETAVDYPHETKHYIDSQIAAAVALALNG